MRVLLIPALLLLALAKERDRSDLPLATANDNRQSGGAVRDGVFRITLVAQVAMWHPDGDSLPGIPVEVFGEPGRPPSAPGPLIRVSPETRIQVTVRNSLPHDTLTFALPSGAASDGRLTADSVTVLPGEERDIATTLRPGTYVYHARTGSTIGKLLGISGALGGALVVDSTTSPRPDRIFVITIVTDSTDDNNFSAPSRSVLAINGRSWPYTERLDASVGDTLHWRVVNTGTESHPMHLHGFYFRVTAAEGPHVAEHDRGPLPRMVVTERVSEYSTMELDWIPERAGNWLFHCHFQIHVLPHGLLDSLGTTATSQRIHNAGRAADHFRQNHALTGMSGLALGIVVKPRGTPAPVDATLPRRSMRLVAVQDSGFPATAPSMRFTLDEYAVHRPGTLDSPTLSLIRGEPVAITVVNRMRGPTAVHWHGIELESYYDGVAGFSGSGAMTTPVIAPGDSFIARFTPPRAGTFIYHSHIDEVVQHRAGLIGALIVREPRDAGTNDRIFLIKSPRDPAGLVPIEVDGSTNPDTAVFKLGQTYRLRLINMTISNPGATFWLTARPDSVPFRPRNDTLGLHWTPIAKDGADYLSSDRITRVANQNVTIGETWDFAFVPERRGNVRLEVWGDAGRRRLLSRIPIRIE